MDKIERVICFYTLATELKDKIRSGWKVWNIERERIESVAEHIYGTCILAIAIDSEFDLQIDLEKTILMLVIHELEEIIIGDITPFDSVTKEEKRRLGKQAVEKVLKPLSKQEKYWNLIEEFESKETKEANFAKMCDKLEADLQCKIYTEEKALDVNHTDNLRLLEDDRIQKLMKQGAKTIADFFIENDKSMYTEKEFLNIAEYIKEEEILKIKERYKKR